MYLDSEYEYVLVFYLYNCMKCVVKHRSTDGAVYYKTCWKSLMVLYYLGMRLYVWVGGRTCMWCLFIFAKGTKVYYLPQTQVSKSLVIVLLIVYEVYKCLSLTMYKIYNVVHNNSSTHTVFYVTSYQRERTRLYCYHSFF